MSLPTNAVAENVLGTIGAVCWSIQLVPQVYKSWKLKNTAGLSSWMLAIWWVGGIFLGAYVVVQNINIPLIVQPQCFAALSGICWAQCLHYDQGKTTKFAITAALLSMVIAGGVEAALIFGAKAAEAHGHGQVTQMAGIVSAIFIAGGLVPQYVEIFRFRAVVGISLIFLLVDLLGGVFSVLSLVFAAGKFDIIASISYGAVAFLEIGVFLLAAILNPSYNRRMAAAKLVDEEALSGGARAPSPVPTLIGVEAGAEVKLPEEVEKRGRSRDVSEMVWRADGSRETVGGDSEEVEGVRRPDSAERRRIESVERTFRA